jgi:RNA polymerase sigma-70 factor (ECF subfamily)
MLSAVHKLEPSGDSDASLMRHAGAGDRRAQRVLAHRLAPRVRRVTRRLLRNQADADDAAQQALLEILRSASGYAERSSVERWADRITARTALRVAREQRRHGLSFGGILELEACAKPTRDVHSGEQTPRALEHYLDRIPAQRREVLMLKHGLGYTTEEIAELIGKPAGTVKDRLVAGRKQLRKLIQRDLKLGVRVVELDGVGGDDD